MDDSTVRPRALHSGDIIGIIAPAGPLENPQALETGIASLRRMGFNVRHSERIFESKGYLAGNDDSRAEELMQFFEDPTIRAILPLRGGYGCSRIVPLLDESRIRSNCKIFMGFSDVTTLHLYFRQQFGWVTIHGPMAVSDALADLSSEQQQHLYSLWTDPSYRPRFSFPSLSSWHGGVADGELVGGCLSLITASLGSPYEIQTEGKILLLEDQGEPPYRVDRMLTQMRLAGKMSNLGGVVLGSFHGTGPEDESEIEETLMDNLKALGVPLLSNFPTGHGRVNWPVPLGTRLLLDADNCRLEYLESSVT